MLRPKAMTASELEKVGIALLSQSNLILQCRGCGAEWRVIKPPRGHLPRGSWKCLNGCNAGQK